MNNLQEMDLVKLDEMDLKTTGGGVVIASFKVMIDGFHWAYTEFKKGLDDGYNNR